MQSGILASPPIRVDLTITKRLLFVWVILERLAMIGRSCYGILSTAAILAFVSVVLPGLFVQEFTIRS
jgi:hypothetical protein